MTAEDYVKILDWHSAIAAATVELDKNPADVESYLYRGIAQCYTGGKEGKHKEAIEDLSKAIFLYEKDTPKINEARYYRAYAYYCDGEYERALADLKELNTVATALAEEATKVRETAEKAAKAKEEAEEAAKAVADAIEKEKAVVKAAADIHPCIDELRGNIYFAMNKYEKAVNSYNAVLQWWYNQQSIPGPCLLDKYREACKRMNSV